MSGMITAEALIEAGYKECPTTGLDNYQRLYQRRFVDDSGTLYFVNFHEWDHPKDGVVYDAEMACDTASGGAVWVTIREDGIRETELRAALMWAAAGSVYYEMV